MKASGIYEIVNSENGKRYVGSAVNMAGRFHAHRTSLHKGKHHSRYLQRAWNLHGSGAFSFNPLIICAKEHLILYEQRAIDRLRPEYNLSPTAGNALGVKWSEEAKAALKTNGRHNRHFIGRKHSAETLAKMAAAQRGNTATKGKKRNPAAIAKTAAAHRGMRRSEETRRRISIAMTGKKLPKSAATRAKLSAALRGRSTLGEEARQRMAATKRGKSLSAEHKAKIGIASRAAWALRKSSGVSDE